MGEEEVVKLQLREEFPQYKVFEETGEFPEGNFDEVLFPSIHQCAKTGNFAQLSERLEEGSKIDDLDEKNFTALSYAAGTGNLQMVSYLCIAGANIKFKDPSGNSLLHLATAFDHPEVLQYLISFGAGHPDHKADFEDNKWATWKNTAGYTVFDVAAANKAGR